MICFSGCLRNHINQSLPSDIPLNWSGTPEISDLPISKTILDLLKNQKIRSLVNEALENNPDLKATALKLKASELLLKASDSQRLPSANIGFSRGRDNHGIDPFSGRAIKQNRYQLSFNMNWELDIWGRLADKHKAQAAELEMQHQDYIHAYDSLSAMLIQSWIKIAGAQQAIDIEKKRIGFLKKIQTILQKRYSSGVGNFEHLSAAKARILTAQADISRLKSICNKQIRSMELLLGRYPGTTEFKIDKLPEILLPGSLPPLTVLKKRPDIKAGIARVKTRTLMALATKKKMLPRLSLVYENSRSSTSLSSLRSSDILWNLIANMVQPVFEGKRLMNEAAAASIYSDAALLELKALVLKAIKEVEDTKNYEYDLKCRAEYLHKALEHAEQSSFYYTARYKKGLVTLQAVLTSLEQEMNIKEQLAEVKSARLVNRIDLALALGIGF